MAALRYAARRLGERALQQAQGSSPVAAAQQHRRLLQHGTSNGRRSRSTASVNGKPKTTVGPHDELKKQFENKKEELFDLLVQVQLARAYPSLSWKDIHNHWLITHLAAQVEPRPHDPIWRRYRGTRRLNDCLAICYCLGFHYWFYFSGSNKKEDNITCKNCEANINSDGRPESD